jgi:undecaprenyl diphosphate synthase
MPDPELLIRTSGEHRLSNFLLWQIAYTEIFMTDLFWPEFREEQLLDSILDFQSRERRFGNIKKMIQD